MKKFVIISLVLLVCLISLGAYFLIKNKRSLDSTSHPVSSLIGMTLPPLPSGITEERSRTMDTGGSGNGLISKITTPTGSELLLESVVGYSNGKITWKIVDAILLPEINGQEYLALNCGTSVVNEQVVADVEMVAIVEKENVPIWTKIHKAWRANLSSNKLEPISTDGIVCHNELLSPYYP